MSQYAKPCWLQFLAHAACSHPPRNFRRIAIPCGCHSRRSPGRITPLSASFHDTGLCQIRNILTDMIIAHHSQREYLRPFRHTPSSTTSKLAPGTFLIFSSNLPTTFRRRGNQLRQRRRRRILPTRWDAPAASAQTGRMSMDIDSGRPRCHGRFT
ncbi:hypothetical protein C8R45DRAFT_117550 [Mycena sanguinolenta]|nr:hypothetical protein C8R45DRAFT_117550 [Mycena sanguinolenta]